LDLQPVLAPAAPVGLPGALGDDPLQGEGAGLAVEVVSLPPDVLGEADLPGRGRGEDLGQSLLAVEEGRLPQVVAIEVEEVEGEVDEILVAAPAQSVLERLE